MANDNKLTVDETEDELKEENLDTDGSSSMSGSAPDPESDDDPEAALKSMVGEIDNTQPFTIGSRLNKPIKNPD